MTAIAAQTPAALKFPDHESFTTFGEAWKTMEHERKGNEHATAIVVANTREISQELYSVLRHFTRDIDPDLDDIPMGFTATRGSQEQPQRPSPMEDVKELRRSLFLNLQRLDLLNAFIKDASTTALRRDCGSLGHAIDGLDRSFGLINQLTLAIESLAISLGQRGGTEEDFATFAEHLKKEAMVVKLACNEVDHFIGRAFSSTPMPGLLYTPELISGRGGN